MGKKKKTETELISISELARRAGTSRQAASEWCKSLEKRGIVVAVQEGRRGKVVDANSAIVTRYIENTSGACARTKEGAESGKEKSGNYLRKLNFQCKKTELQNEIVRGKYIPLDSVKIFFEKLAEVECELFSGFPGKVIERVEKELKIKMPPETKTKAMELLQSAAGNCLESTYRLIKNFESKNAVKTAG
jgi:DNA-binding transcriptional ArsR family regulator